MQSLLLESRKDILFLKNPSNFSENCQGFIDKLEQIIKEQPQNKNSAVTTASDIYLDLHSFLTNWVLRKYVETGSLTQAAIDKEIDTIHAFITKYGDAEKLEHIKDEAKQIAESNIKEMCELELSNKLFTYWGHDYCSGLTHSLRRGARFVTSNPAKINAFRKDFPAIWAGFVEEIKTNNPDISLEKLISYLFLKVVAVSARDLYPIYEASNGKYGFACIQVNPKNWKNADKMIEEIEFWNEEFKKELNTETPNIVYKIPAVSAAVKTVESIVEKGIRVCLTLNFTYNQHDIFSDLIEKGKQHGFVVLMSGFLDDNIDKELASLGIENSKMYSRHAGEAVIRKSYANLRAKGCKNTSIMSAAIRGEWTIKNSITDNADAPMYFTTVTDKILEFDSEKRDLSSVVDAVVPDEIMSVLKKSPIFNAAYEEDSLTLDNVDEYPPLLMVLDIFTKAYIELEDSLK
ncbi:transaldolase family protein [Petroclostridium sp. X23]|uniref:transaldolase family protein n=1 Tax=Petroclostridium sp. X23 TaxID=3045146 RepID=UPI0024ADC114|nr:transaldolase family protein [Petroclostridium sp. X23]WHH57025.1 transaldolase family protein [Petroclostridium sp. X23]